MKKVIIKWIIWSLAGIILILILTNPSNKSYTEFLNTNGYILENHFPERQVSSNGEVMPGPEGYSSPIYKPLWGKKFNFILFSTYRYNDGEHFLIKNHIGILSNFFEMKPSVKK